MKIKQHHYGNIEVDGREKDHVAIWMDEASGNTEVVQVERENLSKLIKALQNEQNQERQKRFA